MPDYHRIYRVGGTYFFTVVTYERQKIFECNVNIMLFEQCLDEILRRHPFIVNAFVIMPDHIHTIWTLPPDDADFSIRWNLLKGNFSRQYKGQIGNTILASRLKHREKTIWQRRFWEHLIRDEEDFNRLCDYIHYNPVKHGFVDSAKKWKYSSIHTYILKHLYPEDWGQAIGSKIVNMDLD